MLKTRCISKIYFASITLRAEMVTVMAMPDKRPIDADIRSVKPALNGGLNCFGSISTTFVPSLNSLP